MIAFCPLTAAKKKLAKEERSSKALSDETAGEWVAYTFNEKGEKVLASDDGQFGIVVYESAQKIEQKVIPSNTLRIASNVSREQPRRKPAQTTNKISREAPVTKRSGNTPSPSLSPLPSANGGGY